MGTIRVHCFCQYRTLALHLITSFITWINKCLKIKSHLNKINIYQKYNLFHGPTLIVFSRIVCKSRVLLISECSEMLACILCKKGKVQFKEMLVVNQFWSFHCTCVYTTFISRSFAKWDSQFVSKYLQYTIIYRRRIRNGFPNSLLLVSIHRRYYSCWH